MFVEKYGEGNTVLSYPECVSTYPNVSAFPSVIVEMPEKTIEGYTVPAYTDGDGVEHDSFTVETETIEAFEYIYPKPTSLEEIDEYVAAYLAEDPGAEYRES